MCQQFSSLEPTACHFPYHKIAFVNSESSLTPLAVSHFHYSFHELLCRKVQILNKNNSIRCRPAGASNIILLLFTFIILIAVTYLYGAAPIPYFLWNTTSSCDYSMHAYLRLLGRTQKANPVALAFNEASTFPQHHTRYCSRKPCMEMTPTDYIYRLSHTFRDPTGALLLMTCPKSSFEVTVTCDRN